MKKIQMIFAAAAVMLAVAGVYASSVVATVYYSPNWAHRTGLACDIVISTTCSDSGSTPCQETVSLENDNGIFVPTQVLVSKKVDGGNCTQVFRNN